MGAREQQRSDQQTSTKPPAPDHEPKQDGHDWRKQSAGEISAFAGARASGSASLGGYNPALDIASQMLGPTPGTLQALIDELAEDRDLASVLAEAAGAPALQLIDWAAEKMPDEVVDFVVTHTSHHMTAFALLKLPSDKLRDVLSQVTAGGFSAIKDAMMMTGQVGRLADAFWDLQASQISVLAAVLDTDTITMFFKLAREKANRYVREELREIWPVGYGLSLKAGLGATWGIPVRTDAAYEVVATRTSEDIVELYRNGTLVGALDTGVSIGGYAGSKKMGVGGQLGVNGQVGLEGIVTQKFEFPLFQDDVFLSFLIAVVGADVTLASGIGMKFSDPLKKLDPDRYNRTTKFDVNAFARGSVGGEGRLGAASASSGDTASPDSKFGNSRDGGPDIGKRTWASRLLRASAFASLDIHAGVSFEFENGPMQVDPATGAAEPEETTVHVSGEGGAAYQLSLAFPFVPQLPLPALDATFGLKVSLRYAKPSSPDAEPRLIGASHSLYHKSGKMDMPTQPETASETSLVFAGAPSFDINNNTGLPLPQLDMFESWEKLMASVSGAKLQRRVGASAWGSSIVNTVRKQKELTAMLRGKYKDWGIRIEGYIDFVFDLNAHHVRLVLAALRDAVGSSRSLPQLFVDMLTFFATGEAPAEVKPAFDTIAGSLAASLSTARAHAQVGLTGVVGGHVAVGAFKARLHAEGTGLVTYDQDIKEEVRDHLQDLRAVVLNPGDPGSSLEIQPGDLDAPDHVTADPASSGPLTDGDTGGP